MLVSRGHQGGEIQLRLVLAMRGEVISKEKSRLALKEQFVRDTS
jgi:hypothetical protein